jgi:hypothetical protein
MAQDSIIQKLRDELILPLRRESQVVYLMAEIRKYLDHQNTDEQLDWRVLSFFCNWALHIKIDRRHQADNIRAFLAAFDLKMGFSLKEYLQGDFYNEIMHLRVLREELKRFFTVHGLPSSLTDNQTAWRRFMYYYTSVVAESPLEYSKGDLLPEDVHSLTVLHLEHKTFGINLVQWNIKLRSGAPYFGSVPYGVERDDNKNFIGFTPFLDEYCQLSQFSTPPPPRS